MWIKAVNKTEKYISVSQLSNLTNIPIGTLWNYFFRKQIRFMKYNGVRWVEINCAISATEFYQIKRGIDLSLAIDSLKNML